MQLAGIGVIRAVIQRPDGTLEPEREIPIDSLRSPFKSAINMSSRQAADRFWRIWRAIQAGRSSQLPPIVVVPGSRGTLVQNLGWIY